MSNPYVRNVKPPKPPKPKRRIDPLARTELAKRLAGPGGNWHDYFTLPEHELRSRLALIELAGDDERVHTVATTEPGFFKIGDEVLIDGGRNTFYEVVGMTESALLVKAKRF